MAEQKQVAYTPEMNLVDMNSKEMRGSGAVRYVKLNPSDGQTSVSLSAATGADIDFNIITAQAWNPSKSSLEFIMQVPGDATITAARFAKILVDTPPITSMRLTDQANKELFSIPDFRKYWTTVALKSISFERFRQRGPVFAQTTLTFARSDRSPCHFANPSKSTPGAAMAAGDPNNVRRTAAGALAVTSAFNSRYSIQQVLSGAADGTDGYDDCYIRCSIQFADLVGTFLSMNRLYHNASGLRLYVTWANTNRFAFMGTAVNSLAGAAALTSGVILSEINLRLATESDATLSEMVKARYRESVQMTTPIMRHYLKAVGTVTSDVADRVINASEYSRLLRVYSALYVSNDSLGLANLSGNYEAELLKKYRTFLNNVQLQSEDVDIEILAADELYNRGVLQHSLYDNWVDLANRHWAHVDVFAANKDLQSATDYDTRWDGMPVENNTLYQFDIQSKAATNSVLYQCFVGQRSISFDSFGNLQD